MKGLTDLSASERGIIVVLSIVAATVLASPLCAVLTTDQWLDFVRPIVYVFIGAQTITTAASILKGTQTTEPTGTTYAGVFEDAARKASGQAPTPVPPAGSSSGAV